MGAAALASADRMSAATTYDALINVTILLRIQLPAQQLAIRPGTEDLLARLVIDCSLDNHQGLNPVRMLSEHTAWAATH